MENDSTISIGVPIKKMCFKLSIVMTSLFFLVSCISEIEGEMILIEGGECIIGSESGKENEKPRFRAEVKSFYLDKHPVTVAQFRQFVNATNYITEAEKFGNSLLFNFISNEYELSEGVYWEYPFGKDGDKAKASHPVTHVSWNDAMQYAKWANKRLPTEIEWEYAARYMHNNDDIYAWGNSVKDKKGNYLVNFWQGNFPLKNDELDGYRFTSEVGEFGITNCGLTGMGGNVWEWCADVYRPYDFPETHPNLNKDMKVIRGGSFMCDPKVCHGFRVSARSFTSLETSNFHLGFRCAKGIKELSFDLIAF